MSDGAAGPSGGETVDAFHRGAFHLVQPKTGHRSGVDAMILAASVPSGFDGEIADIGSGAGAAGLAVAARCPACRVTLIERDPAMAAYAQRTLALAQNAAFAGRIAVFEADATWRRPQREAAGLADESQDFAIMNPPFNDPRDRQTPDGTKRGAHVMEDGLFEDWIRTAAALVRNKGGLAVIARPQSMVPILDAMQGRFGGAEILPVLPRADQPAIRIVVRAWRSSRKALSLMPALVLHAAGSDGFTSRADAINNGRASLFGD